MLKAQLESLLFLSPNPISFGKLKDFLKVEELELEETLQSLRADYAEGRGVLLLVQEHQDKQKNEYQFVSVPEHADFVQKFFRLQDGVDLTKTAIETLTIVAYRGPVKRTEIEYVRGVNSRQILNQLLSRDLVVEVDEDVFETSGRFLQLLGLTKLEDLDNYESLHNLSLMEEQTASVDVGELHATPDEAKEENLETQNIASEEYDEEKNVETRFIASDNEEKLEEDENQDDLEEEIEEDLEEIAEILEEESEIRN